MKIEYNNPFVTIEKRPAERYTNVCVHWYDDDNNERSREIWIDSLNLHGVIERLAKLVAWQALKLEGEEDAED